MGAAPDVDHDQDERPISTVSDPPVADRVYQAALEDLLACARQPPGGLVRLKGRIASGLRTLQALLWNMLESLPPEY
jgi:hypothetical protein